jgi:hypothetical protein
VAAPLYSTLLFTGSNPTTADVSSAVVGSGFLWVVRDIAVLTPGLPYSNDGGWGIFDPQSFPIFALPNGSSAGAHCYVWEGRQVIPAGQYLVFHGSLAGYSWRVSGYVLTAP